MADLPPKQPDPPEAAKAVPTDLPPAPQLLVMPPTEAIPSLVWPGADGEPAWAIPVQIPPGTRGYALFVPMVPVQASAPAVTKQADQPEKPAATPAVTTPAVTTPAVTPPTATPAAATRRRPAAGSPSGGSHSGVSRSGGRHSGGRPLRRRPLRRRPLRQPLRQLPRASTPALPPTKAPPPGPQRPQPQTPQYPARPFGTYERPPSAWQTFREKHWPGPKKAQGWAVPAGVLAGALGFLIFLPLNRVGIGWFLGWLALTLGVAFAVRRSTDLPRRERLLRSGWAVAALALLLIPAFRNAWWLVTFSVLGAIGCTALAIVGGRQVRSILFSLVAAPYAAFAGIPWVRRHLKASRNPGNRRADLLLGRPHRCGTARLRRAAVVRRRRVLPAAGRRHPRSQHRLDLPVDLPGRGRWPARRLRDLHPGRTAGDVQPGHRRQGQIRPDRVGAGRCRARAALRRFRGGAVHRAVRGKPARAGDGRAQLLAVRPERLLAAGRGHAAVACADREPGPLGETGPAGGTGAATRTAGSALRPERHHRRVRAVADVGVPAGLQLHR